MRKFWLLLASVFIASSLVGCGGGGTEEESPATDQPGTEQGDMNEQDNNMEMDEPNGADEGDTGTNGETGTENGTDTETGTEDNGLGAEENNNEDQS